MAERIGGLDQVAEQGNIDEFYKLIKNNVKLLEHIDELPFVDTPLHTSASAGHVPFSLEMMILKPSFVSKRNEEGHTPIHLALQKGHTEMVCQLLQHNADLVRVKGKECMTLLHFAAIRKGLEPSQYEAKTKDYLALLKKNLSVCPDSITDVTIRNETALHIALKNNNLEAFKFLVGWLLRKRPDWKKILKQKDVEGNTILHIAVSGNQTLAVSHLLDSWVGRFVNIINEKNLEGETALDIFEGQRRQGVDNIDMRVLLKSAGALTASSLPTINPYAKYQRLPGICEAKKIICIGNKVMKRMTDEKRNALLVVAALLVTVTYQAAITPPGGLWQDDLFKPNTTDVLRRSPDDLYKLNITAPHRAGSAIAWGTNLFRMFVAFNSAIFYCSIAFMVALLLPDESVGMPLAILSIFLFLSYSCSMGTITNLSAIYFFLLPIISFIVSVAMPTAVIGSCYLLRLIRKEKLKKKYSRA